MLIKEIIGHGDKNDNLLVSLEGQNYSFSKI